jgi:hypothetical protein
VHLVVANATYATPDFDFCLREATVPAPTYVGPLMGSVGAAGLSRGEVSGAFGFALDPNNQYDLRLVAPGASDCSTPLSLGPDPLATVTLAGGVNIAAQVIFVFGSSTEGAGLQAKLYPAAASVRLPGSGEHWFFDAAEGSDAYLVITAADGGSTFDPHDYYGYLGSNGTYTAEDWVPNAYSFDLRLYPAYDELLSTPPFDLPADTIHLVVFDGPTGDPTSLQYSFCEQPQALATAATPLTPCTLGP